MTTATRTRKAKAPKIVESITFLNRYVIKATQSIVWHVRNGENKEYCVTLNQNGTTGCYNKETTDECPGHTYAYSTGHECHHIVECQSRESERVTTEKPTGAFYVGLDGKEYAIGEEEEGMTMHPADVAIDAEIAMWDCDEITYDELSEGAKNTLASIERMPVEVDEEYELWKAENRLDSTMSEDQVNDFITCELAVE